MTLSAVEKLRAYYKAYRESHRKEQKAYRDAHKEEARNYREGYKEQKRAYNESHKDELAAYRREYYDSHKEKTKMLRQAYYQADKERDRVLHREYNKQYPERAKAGDIVTYAVKTGQISREPCQVCGSNENLCAHHDDYALPLAVVWLCAKHHKARHWRLRGGTGRTYLVVSNKVWVKRIMEQKIKGLEASVGNSTWLFSNSPYALRLSNMDLYQPYQTFVLHWGHSVSEEVIHKYTCINFHMTALPFGRGGSPLQNLIVAGHEDTLITAHRMTSEIDAGPIYLQNRLSLNGLAEEVYLRATDTCFDMMKAIVENEPEPTPQIGKATYFKRRTPEQSEIPWCGPSAEGLDGLFDHIRMLDCEGYPKAFLVHEGYRYEFSRPALRDGRIVADVEIRKNTE